MAVSRLVDGVEDTASVDKALAAMGLKRDAPAEPEAFGLWPENWKTFLVYWRLHDSQWVVAGMGGLVGLNYTAMQFFLDLEQVPTADRREVVTGVQAMEREARRLMREKSEK